ncbi:MarR family winged helix-turn-helix transcriptional regulator [Micromonospora rubida]|uniref:MarR family winged helix-turn-helix transcriptional regulator n=1 Tax=Micromonospora rubida TaxID=2697657 RepID=UPI0013775622|nr:MarR family transcriptional regulator [Micromonospora rubida]NBE81263.1 MarR family transcriptional regulator [Micromonospora rubida]
MSASSPTDPGGSAPVDRLAAPADRLAAPAAGEPSRSGATQAGFHVSAEAADDASALIQLSGLVQGTFARVADRHDLTVVQGRLLCVLAEKPRGMAELARIFGVGKAGLTGLIDRAAQRGLVERSLVPGDRRAVHVLLTEDGRRSAVAFHSDVTSELNSFLAPLTAEARTGFGETVTTITNSTDHTGRNGPQRAGRPRTTPDPTGPPQVVSRGSGI